MPYFSMRKTYPNAKDIALVVLPMATCCPRAMDQIRTVSADRTSCTATKPDDFRTVDCARDGGTVPPNHIHDVPGDGSSSSIGLLVGGIGVMNIMLVSVTERTKEIGIRKAIGARRIDIIMQFLLEAVVLTGIGGLIGIGLGWMIAAASKLVFTSLPTAVPAWAAILGIGVSVGVQAPLRNLAGKQSSQARPVEALRYE